MQAFFTGGKGRRALDGVKQFTTLIGNGTHLTGTLRGSENCIVNGSVEGNCEIDGTLVLGETGRWHGNITATMAIISGEIVGDIVTGEKLELSASARITGNITSPVVAMAEGAIHQGGIKMTRGGGALSNFQEKRKGSADRES